MKRIVALSLVLMLGLSLLAGCKKKQESAPGSDTAAVGAVQTCGTMDVYVPAGWTLVNQDMSAYLCLGSGDPANESYINLQHFAPGAFVSAPLKEHYTDVQELEAMTFGDHSWSGFSGSRNGIRAIVLTTSSDVDNFMAVVSFTESSGVLSLEDPDVQSILSGVTANGKTVETEAAPSQPAGVAPSGVIGDWSGTVTFTDCSGDFETMNNATYDCVARFTMEENNILLPYVGLDEDAGFLMLDATAPIENSEATLSPTGSWNDVSFNESTSTLENGTLTLHIPISSETGELLMQITLKPLTDNSFAAKAEALGCIGY